MFTVIWKENGEYKSEKFYSEEKAKELGRRVEESGFGIALIRKDLTGA